MLNVKLGTKHDMESDPSWRLSSVGKNFKLKLYQALQSTDIGDSFQKC